MDEAAILARFLELYRADLDKDGPRPCSDYQALFPGFEDIIAREYADLGSHAACNGATSRGSHASRSWIGPFRVIEELARGGQGEVYLAEDPRLQRQVAVKVLRGTGAFTEQALSRFRREAEVTARLEHPGICPVYESGTADGIAYIVMKHIPGQSLAEQISDSRAGSTKRVGASNARGRAHAQGLDGEPRAATPSLSERKALLPGRSGIESIVGLARQVALALHAAHEKGIIHRDVKPGNIMVTPASEAVLVDFGFAREDDAQQPLTRSGDLFGTPAYMSPEQLARQATRIDRRSDVWSLGVTLYEALTLVRPFEAPTREALHHAILTEIQQDPRRLNRALPRDLRVVLETALEKDRERRYQTARAFADDLAAVLGGRPIAAKPVGPWARLTRWAAREPAKAGLVALAVAAIPTIAGLVALRVQDLPRIAAQRAAELHAQLEALLLDAYVMYESGDAEGALRRYQAAMDLEPRSVEAIIGLVMTQDATDRREEALQTLEINAVTLGGRRPAMWCRNNILRALGREVPEAELPPPRDAIDHYLEGQQLMANARVGHEDGYLPAKVSFLSAICLSSAPRLPYYTWAIDAASHCEDWETVEMLDRALLRLWPSSGIAHHWRGIALSRGGDVDGAMEADRESIRWSPDVALYHNNLGRGLAHKERFDEALPPLREAIRLAPGDSRPRATLGRVLGRLNRADEALDELNRAITCEPPDPAAFRYLGDLHVAGGRVDEAVEAYLGAVALDSSDRDSYFALGSLYGRKGQLDDACHAYRQAIAANPDSPGAHGNLGLVLRDQGKLQEALAETERAIILNQRNQRFRVNQSDILMRLGRFADAAVAARAAIEIDPTYPEAHFCLGDALRDNGEFGAALDAMRRGQQLSATRPGGQHQSEGWVRNIENLVVHEQRLLRVAAGEETAQGPDDLLKLGDLASWTKRWRLAAGWYAAAIEAWPELPDVKRGLALRSARAVAQACGEDGDDSRRSSAGRPDELAALRARALEWMRRELDNRRGDLAPEELARALGSWRADPLLAPLRDEAHLLRLPAEEAGAWTAFWADVEATIR
jgi:serine/threonine protein kinase/tetratricopeptide (TPR) repeat protein